jgi:hypothetical protein
MPIDSKEHPQALNIGVFGYSQEWDFLKKGLCNITSLTPKCSYLRFSKILKHLDYILTLRLWKMGGNSKSSKKNCSRVTHNCYSCCTFPYIANCSSRFLNFAWDCINGFLAWDIAWRPLHNCFRDVVSLWITWWTPSKKMRVPLYFLIIHET